jgi:hypothetical protein
LADYTAKGGILLAHAVNFATDAAIAVHQPHYAAEIPAFAA